MRPDPLLHVLTIAATVRQRAEELAATSFLSTLAEGQLVSIDPATLGGLCKVATRGLLRAWRASGVRRGAIIEGKFGMPRHPAFDHVWAEFGPWWIDLTATQYAARGYLGLERVHVVRAGAHPWYHPQQRSYLRAAERKPLEHHLQIHERWWEEGAPLLASPPR